MTSKLDFEEGMEFPKVTFEYSNGLKQVSNELLDNI